MHIVYLHQAGSNNPLGVDGIGDKVPFHIYYTLKDLVGFRVMLWALIFVCLLKPGLFLEPENFNPADPLVTPVHIQPEWYFLFAYAILRSIPNKAGGVLALVCSVFVLLVPPILSCRYLGCLRIRINPINQFLFWFFVGTFGILRWIGVCPVEDPYIGIGQLFTLFYFVFFFLFPLVIVCW